jgi:hypothetical protein
MRERIESLGGTLEAGPRRSGGWSLRAVVPVGARCNHQSQSNRPAQGDRNHSI